MPLGPPLTQKGRQFHPLSLPTRKSIGRLSKFYITKAHITQGLDFICNIFLGLEKFQCIVYTHFQHIVNILLVISDFKDFLLELLTTTNFAGKMNISQELHFYDLFPLPFAGVTTTAIHIE